MKITPIKMGGKTRNIKFGISTVAALEKELGRPISTLDDKTLISELILIMFYGLKWEDKELKLDEVGDLMDSAIEEHGDFATVSKMLVETLVSSFGKKAIPSKK